MNAVKINKLLFLTFVLMLSACLEKEEGCLDPNATNLDVSADVNANCTYPVLQLGFDHRWGDQTYRLGDTIHLDNGDTLAILDFSCFVSNIKLGETPALGAFDSVRQDDGDFIRDDLTIASLDALTANVGHVRNYGTYNGLDFAIGFGSEWRTVDTAELMDEESNHPWFESTLRGSNDQRYVINFDFELIHGDTTERNLNLVGPRLLQLKKDVIFTTVQANNALVKLVINYERLLDGIELRLAADDVILESMLMNMEASIQVSD